MQYPGVEYQTLYTRSGKIYKTLGFAAAFKDENASRMVLFTNVNGNENVYYMPEAEFETQFEKVNKYT